MTGIAQTGRSGILADFDFSATPVSDYASSADMEGYADFAATPLPSSPMTWSLEFDLDAGDTPYPGYPFCPTDEFGLLFEPDVQVSPQGSFIWPLEFDNSGGGGGGSGGDQGGGGASFGTQLPLGPYLFSKGAVQLTAAEEVTAGLDSLNRILGLLVPAAPPNFPNGTLSVSNAAGSSPVLAAGATDNAGGASGIAAGASVTRISASGVSTYAFHDVGPGDQGTISVYLNGSVAASHVLAGTNDDGTYSGLLIANQGDYPAATPGFWKAIDVSLSNLPVPVGVSGARMTDTQAGTTNTVYFVRDDMTASPGVSNGSVALKSAGATVYSSSVPHFATGGALTVGCSLSNLAGQTYYGGSDPLSVQGTNGLTSDQTFNYGALGIATPIHAETTSPQAITPITVNVDGSTHASGKLQALAKNVNGSSGWVDLGGPTLLVKRGTASGSQVDELSIPVSGLGASPNGANAKRVGYAGGDTPAGPESAWNPSAPLNAWDATVVGGVLKQDQTNYSTGYLPAGPDLSQGRSGAQYATFSFDRTALSAFKITIQGSYAGCWIKLPGVSDQAAISPNAANGWWNAFQSYSGAGTPGNPADANAGCALGAVMNGGSGAFQITFGTETSTNSTGNEILVRLKLNPGQSVTSLSFTN